MKPNKQQISIAEYLGWTWMSMYSHVASGKQLLGSRDVLHGTPPRDKGKPEEEQAFEPVPDYTSDLNAMHEAEKSFVAGDWRYVENLKKVTGNEDNWHASVGQRAEAFLRTIGRWEDEKLSDGVAKTD